MNNTKQYLDQQVALQSEGSVLTRRLSTKVARRTRCDIKKTVSLTKKVERVVGIFWC